MDKMILLTLAEIIYMLKTGFENEIVYHPSVLPLIKIVIRAPL